MRKMTRYNYYAQCQTTGMGIYVGGSAPMAEEEILSRVADYIPYMMSDIPGPFTIHTLADDDARIPRSNWTCATYQPSKFDLDGIRK